MKPQAVNRLTAGLATGVFVVLSLLLASVSTTQRGDALLRRPSTFFTDPSGARAFFLVVQRFLPAAEQWRRPFEFLPDPREAGTIFIAGPQRALGGREAKDLEQWLHRGGQLILLTANGWPMRRRSSAGAKNAAGDAPAASDGARPAPTFLARWEPSLTWARPAKELRADPASGPSLSAEEIIIARRAAFRKTGGARVIASTGHAPFAVEIPVGRGRIVAVADPEIASNGALRRSDNAVWLLGLMAGRGGKILFDEYHHGFGQKRGTMELTRAFSATPWGWCVLQLAAAGLLHMFAYRRRFGRIREPPAAERSSPLELIAARAGVFRAARAQRLAAELIVQHLCQSLGRAHGRLVDSTRLERELDETLQRGAPDDGGGLRRTFGKVCTGEHLSDREFIELGKSASEIIEGKKP